jgi:hypothetical protein
MSLHLIVSPEFILNVLQNLTGMVLFNVSKRLLILFIRAFIVIAMEID